MAGRGTDLTANKELEINGGVHVILSFYLEMLESNFKALVELEDKANRVQPNL